MARVLLSNVGFLILALVFLTKMFDFWINLLVVAVIPALCEEMLFRGMIPKALLGTGFAYALYKSGFIFLCNSCTFSIIGLLC